MHQMNDRDFVIRTIVLMLSERSSQEALKEADYILTDNFALLNEMADHYEVVNAKEYDPVIANMLYGAELTLFKSYLEKVRNSIRVDDEILFNDTLFRCDCRSLGPTVANSNIVYDRYLNHINRNEFIDFARVKNGSDSKLFMVNVNIHM